MKSFLFIAAGLICYLSSNAAAAVDFAKDIQPILQNTCVKCHGPEKQKGKLRMDSKQALFKGGTDGEVIVPGKADKSDVYRRITLPKGHDDIMPSEGEPLSKAQIDLIRDWINEGAVWPDGLVIQVAGGAAKEKEKALPPAPKQTGAETKAIAQIEKLGVSVRPIAMNVGWRQANFRSVASSVTDATIAPLKDIATLTDLNLGSTQITDAGLTYLKGLVNLSRLHLENTKITDAGLAQLKGLTKLTYLNLFGTAVSDKGLESLQGMSELRHLYVWQTKVTDAGVAKLKKVLPNVDVSTGWDLKELAKIEAQAKENAKKDEAKKDTPPAKKAGKKKK